MALTRKLSALLRQLHKILGLALSIYVLLISLSGLVLLFREELQSVLRPLPPASEPFVFRADPDQVLAQIRERYPQWRPLSLTWPHEAAPFWLIFLLNGPQSMEIFVDTATGAIVATHDPHSSFLGFTDRLHGNLTWGRNGRLLNGYGAIGMIILALSGLFLVLPRLRLIRWRRPWQSSRDLHYSVGLLCFVFLFAIAFTGAYFTWSGAFINFAKTYLGRSVEPTLPPSTSTTVLRLSQLIRQAQLALPGKTIYRVPIPDAKYPWRATFQEASFAQFHQISSVTLDPRDGSVLRVQRLAERPLGDSFLGWLSAFHFGAFALGPLSPRFVQLFWALQVLGLIFLTGSGIALWWRNSRRR